MQPERLKYLRRYSLRTLFLVMTLCCLVFGAWAAYVNPYRLQQRSLAAVNRLQGNVVKVPAQGPQWHVWLVTTLLGDEAFMYVTEVDLNNRKVSDADLNQLANLVHLRELSLDYAPVTDDGLAVLRSLPRLQHISLRYTKATDETARHLSNLPDLQSAHLTGTKITDAGIRTLYGHPQLVELFIRWTGVTDSGAERLAAALPNCAVYHHALAAP